MDKGYLVLSRDWAKGDKVELDLPMHPARIYANPKVKADRARVALRYGPMVYCIEQADQQAPVPQIVLPPGAEVSALERRDLFDGIITLTARGRAVAEDWKADLYRATPPTLTDTTITAIPYYLWCNRGQGPMSVWLREA